MQVKIAGRRYHQETGQPVDDWGEGHASTGEARTMVGKPVPPSTSGSSGKAMLGKGSSIGEMWIGAKQAVNTCDKTAQMRAFNRGFIHAPGMRICGSSVDDMCAQLYESNQPSNRYNKIL
jgi:hypothetical protein